MYERKFMHKDRRDAVVEALDFHPQNQSSIPIDTRLQNDLYCVEWDIRP